MPALTINLRRRLLLTIPPVLLLLLGMFAISAIGFLWPSTGLIDGGEQPATRAMAGGCALLWGVLSLFLGYGLYSAVRQPRLIRFDQTGITWRVGAESNTVAWHDLAGVGIAWNNPPSLNASEAAVHAMIKNGWAVELYLADPLFGAPRYPGLTRWIAEEEPPQPWLPKSRYRLILPPMKPPIDKIEEVVQAYRAPAWLGKYRRAWDGGLITPQPPESPLPPKGTDWG